MKFATPPLLRRVTLVFGAALGLACGYAGLYFSSLAIFLKPIAADFSWGRASVSAVTVTSLLGTAVAAPMVGALMDKVGAWYVIVASILLFSLTLLTFSLLPNNLPLFAAMSFFAGVFGAATGPNGYAFVISRSFDRHLGLALSLAMVGVGIGAVISPIVAQSIITSADWRNAYRALACAALVLGGVALLTLRWGSNTRQSISRAGVGSIATAAGDSLASAAKTRVFWTVLGVAGLVAASGLGAAIHMSAMLTDLGMSSRQAAQVAAAVGTGIMCGRLFSGMLMDVVHAPLIGAGALLLGAVGLWSFGSGVATGLLMSSASAFLIGLSLGTEGDLFAFIARRYFGLKAFGLIYGVTMGIYCIGGVAGPILFGYAFDHTRTYSFVMHLSAAGLAASALAILTLGTYRYGPAPTASVDFPPLEAAT